MKFVETGLGGAYVIEPENHSDERGFFGRTFCRREFDSQGLNSCVAQCSVSFNRKQGTLRGMHFQVAPHQEAKLVRCTMGSIFDVIIDLRPNSPTLKRYFSVVLSAENRTALYVPEGFAHGFQTFEDNSEVFYQISEFYSPECARGVRWNDPTFAIHWPDDERIILDRDQSYPDFAA